MTMGDDIPMTQRTAVADKLQGLNERQGYHQFIMNNQEETKSSGKKEQVQFYSMIDERPIKSNKLATHH